eukprot:m.257180 g.257180  ORF g.257180 m.257180 type:complete len:1540 (-) comp17581_c0_seq2:954-5573(-)
MAPSSILAITGLLLPLIAAQATDVCFTKTCNTQATACSSATCQAAMTILAAGCNNDQCTSALANATASLGINDITPFSNFASCYVPCRAQATQPDPCNVTCATAIANCNAIPACQTAFALASDDCNADCIQANRPNTSAAGSAYDVVASCFRTCDDGSDEDDDDIPVTDLCDRQCGEPQFLCQSNNDCLQAVQQLDRLGECDVECMLGFRPVNDTAGLLFDNYMNCLYSCSVTNERSDDTCPFDSIFKLNPCQFQGCYDQQPPFDFTCCQYSQTYCNTTDCSTNDDIAASLSACTSQYQLTPDRTACNECTTLRQNCQDSSLCAPALIKLDDWMLDAGDTIAACNASCVDTITGNQPSVLPTLRKILGCAQTCSGDCPLSTISNPDLSPCNSPSCSTFPSLSCCQHLSTYCQAYPADCTKAGLFDPCSQLGVDPQAVAQTCAAQVSACAASSECADAWANTTKLVSQVYFGDWVLAACDDGNLDDCGTGLEPVHTYQAAVLYAAALNCSVKASANASTTIVSTTQNPSGPIRVAFVDFDANYPSSAAIVSTPGSTAGRVSSIAGRTGQEIGVSGQFFGVTGPNARNNLTFPVKVPDDGELGDLVFMFLDFLLAADGLTAGDTVDVAVKTVSGDTSVFNITANSTGGLSVGDEFYSVDITSFANPMTTNLPIVWMFDVEVQVQLASSAAWVAIDNIEVVALRQPISPTSSTGNCTFDDIRRLSPCNATSCELTYSYNVPFQPGCCWHTQLYCALYDDSGCTTFPEVVQCPTTLETIAPVASCAACTALPACTTDACLRALGNLTKYLAPGDVYCDGSCVRSFLELETLNFDVTDLPEADLYYGKAACLVGCDSNSLCPFKTATNDSLGNPVATPCLAPQCLSNFWEFPSRGCCEYVELFCNLTGSCGTGARLNALAACSDDNQVDSSFACSLATGVVCRTGTGAQVKPDIALRTNITLNTCLATCTAEFEDAPTGCSASFTPLPEYVSDTFSDDARGACYIHDTGRCEQVNKLNGYLWSCTQSSHNNSSNSSNPQQPPCVFQDQDSITSPCSDFACDFAYGFDSSPRCCALAYYHCQSNTTDTACGKFEDTIASCSAVYALDEVITCDACDDCGTNSACNSATAIVNAIVGSLGLSLNTIDSIIPSTASDADKSYYWSAARCYAACNNQSACPFAVGYQQSPCASLSCFTGFAQPSFECCAESLGLCFANFSVDPFCRQPGFTTMQANCLATHFNYTGPLSTPAASTMFASTSSPHVTSDPSTTTTIVSTRDEVVSTIPKRTASQGFSTSAEIQTEDREATTAEPDVVVLMLFSVTVRDVDQSQYNDDSKEAAAGVIARLLGVPRGSVAITKDAFISSSRRALNNLKLDVEVATVRSQLDRLRAAIRDLQDGTDLAEALKTSSSAFEGITSTSVTDASTSEPSSSNKSANTGLIVGIVVAAVVVLAVVVLLMTRAANKNTSADDEAAGPTQSHFSNPAMATTDVDRQGDGNYMHNSNAVYRAEDPRHDADNGDERLAMTNDTYATGEQAQVMNAWEDSSA